MNTSSQFNIQNSKLRMIDREILNWAKILWDYHHVHHALKKADIIICFTSLDLSVPVYVAKLFQQGLAPVVLFSGNEAKSAAVSDKNNIQRTDWGMPEADKFADEAIKHGVPKKKILIENKSSNSGENVVFTYNLLKDKAVVSKKIILVQKPTMERRAYATFKKLWPEQDYELVVNSPPHTFEEYVEKVVDADTIINIMVGDVQRIALYPDKGFQIFQEIPKAVRQAYNKLVERGYAKHLIDHQNETL